ncbi:hypothetical protein BH10BAC3_BH10BAC3_00930 [soil metagenome]
MKKLFSTLKNALLLLPALFIFSCKHPAEKNIRSSTQNKQISASEKNDTNNTHPKKDDVVKKGKTDSPAKTGISKWKANTAASKIGFSVKGPFGTVNGSFSGLQSTILFDKDKLATSSIIANVSTSSISTGVKLRNSDLQKEKYLDAAKHPTISFKSDKIEKSGSGYKAIGEMTIKGISKHQEIPFSFTEKGNEAIFKGTFTIQRQDYGIGKPGGSIGNNVTVDFTIPVSKTSTNKQ